METDRNQTIIRLNIVPPYNFRLLLRFLSRWRHPAIDFVNEDAYRRLLRHNNALILLDIQQESTETLAARVLASTADVEGETLKTRLSAVLGLDAFASDFWTWIRPHVELWPVLAPVEGLVLPRTESTYEALILSIIEQQIAWTAAQRAQRLLCEWGGEGLDYGGAKYFAVPSPARLAQATPLDLKMLKITDRRSALLIRIAEEVAAGTLDLESIRALAAAGRYARLTSIKGVGHWTAVVALSRAFGTHPDAASNDVALRAAVKRYLPQHAAAADPVAAAFAGCGDYAGPAAMMLLSRYVLDKY